MKERTLAIIKPDAFEKGIVGKVISRAEAAGLNVAAMRMTVLTLEGASDFYAEHQGRSYFDELVRFVTSGPVVVMVLEGEDAVARWRQLMGPTDCRQAPAGTIRGDFATNISRNTVHGSDSAASARREIAFFDWFLGEYHYERRLN